MPRDSRTSSASAVLSGSWLTITTAWNRRSMCSLDITIFFHPALSGTAPVSRNWGRARPLLSLAITTKHACPAKPPRATNQAKAREVRPELQLVFIELWLVWCSLLAEPNFGLYRYDFPAGELVGAPYANSTLSAECTVFDVRPDHHRPKPTNL